MARKARTFLRPNRHDGYDVTGYDTSLVEVDVLGGRVAIESFRDGNGLAAFTPKRARALAAVILAAAATAEGK